MTGGALECLHVGAYDCWILFPLWTYPGISWKLHSVGYYGRTWNEDERCSEIITLRPRLPTVLEYFADDIKYLSRLLPEIIL